MDDEKLSKLLVYAIEQGKSNYQMISRVLAELAALRETVRGLDPTFADVMEQKRLEWALINAPAEIAVVEIYDRIISRVRDGEPS